MTRVVPWVLNSLAVKQIDGGKPSPTVDTSRLRRFSYTRSKAPSSSASRWRRASDSADLHQIGRIVNDFLNEIANASLLIEGDRLQRALNQVNEAVLLAARVAEDVREAVLEKLVQQGNLCSKVIRSVLCSDS
ncbi:MAG: hypothetical protein NVSMB60_20100 [Mycobacterium sp.]